ncbi:MAG: ABC transporter permease [Rubrivivax sp.]|nr:ABC transporter permease [Rubrivivax sp.]
MWNIAPIAHALWHRKTGALLIATQVALTLAILCNALGVVLDRRDQSTRPTGTDEANLFFLQVITPGYDDDPFGTQRAAEALLRAVPGVRAASWVNQVPLSNSGSSSGMSSEDGKTQFLNSAHYSTGGSLVQAFGLQLVQGRDFTPDEYAELDLRRSRQPPTQAMVTRALAEELYPGAASVVGRRMRWGIGADDLVVTIIGVVDRLVGPWGRAEWLAGDRYGERAFITAVRTNERENYVVRTEPGQRDRVLREAAARLQAAVPGRILLNSRSLEQTREMRYRGERWLAGLLLLVTGLLLVMTAAGIVGLASLWVTQRRRQIGVRRALGARRIDIVWHFVLENGMITWVGVVAGLTLAVALNSGLTRWTTLPPLQWPVLLGGALLMPLLGVLAVLGPALRAAHITPAEATRGA